MASSGANLKRSRWFARGVFAAMAAAVVTIAAWAVASCGESFGDLCDVSRYIGGDKNATFLQTCCDPALYEGDPVTVKGCPNYGTDAGPDARNETDAALDAVADAPADAVADAPMDMGPAPCAGQCLPWPPDGWALPQLVSIGPEAEVPACPPGAVTQVYAGHVDLDAGPLPCGQCVCGAPDGGCVLPATITANGAPCGKIVSGTPTAPFDPPTVWDGGCTANDAIAACDGGFCVESITVAPPVVNEGICAPIDPPLPEAAPAWSFARACMGQAAGACAGGLFCAPPGEGFRVCVAHEGDRDCEDAVYTERHLAFKSVDDLRSCSPCTCGAPSGSTCSVTISMYDGAGCMPSEVVVDAGAPSCTDVVKGTALSSKSASAPAYVPGTCEPGGGVPVGAAMPANTTTFCCMP